MKSMSSQLIISNAREKSLYEMVNHSLLMQKCRAVVFNRDSVCERCGKVYKKTMTYQRYCGSNKKRLGCSLIMSKGGKKRLRLRFRVFQRNGFTCQYCGRKAPDVVLHVDHKFPHSKGGNYSLNNLITACGDCNIGKGDLLLEN